MQLVALDDGYEPAKCGPNMRKFTNQEQILTVIGNVGTSTFIVVKPIANEKN